MYLQLAELLRGNHLKPVYHGGSANQTWWVANLLVLVTRPPLLLAIAWVALFVIRRKFIRKDTVKIIAALERIEGKLDTILENHRRP